LKVGSGRVADLSLSFPDKLAGQDGSDGANDETAIPRMAAFTE